jgi:hypothetical protein
MLEVRHVIHKYSGSSLLRCFISNVALEHSVLQRMDSTAHKTPDVDNDLGLLMRPKDMAMQHLILLDMRLGR